MHPSGSSGVFLASMVCNVHRQMERTCLTIVSVYSLIMDRSEASPRPSDEELSFGLFRKIFTALTRSRVCQLQVEMNQN